MQKKYQKKEGFLSRHRKVLIVATVLLVAAGGSGAYVWHTRNLSSAQPAASASNKAKPIGTVDYGPPAATDNTASNTRKDNPDAAGDTLDTFPAGTNSGSITVTVTRATADPAEKTIQVGTQVDGVTAGTCELTFTKQGSAAVTKTANVRLEGNSYTCGLFTVPYSDFPVSGDWTAALGVTSGNTKGTGTWPAAVRIEK